MKGFCFLGEPEGGKRHLKIVLTEPNEAGQVVIVTVTSLKPPKRQDTSCILHAGDHPFIRHDSVIEFKLTTAMSSVTIFNRLSNGNLIRKENMPAAALERVLAAAKSSWQMPPRIKAMLFYAYSHKK